MTPKTLKVDSPEERGRVTGDRSRAEEARIRAAYARRGGAWRYDWGNPAYVFMMHDVERRVLAALRRSRLWPLGARRILDVGCGTGYWLQRLIAWGAQPQHAAGIDLLRDRVCKDIRPVKAAGIRRLFPGCSVELDRVTLATPVTRLVAPLSWTLCALLNLVPPMRTHYLGVIRRR